ncbi:RDD family protein [Conchiformibius kuhniae]|uniref:RDD family protein n=1 Tax=Conchiformibius kuhniae TaxID=211502 RepID=A0A8T9MWG5_9NEIS|nr:RDD family protein [Conchiformibius kuhniae]UOP04532.1 RDD family protein [Conchiformibius kuhniae]
MSSYRDQVSFSFQDGHKRYRWLLASPAERILATVADAALGALAAAPLLWSVYQMRHTPHHFDVWAHVFLASPLMWGGAVLLSAYVLWQALWLAQRGQTLGKRLLGIRIIRDNGHVAGFFHCLMLRTVVFVLLCVIMIGGTLMLLRLDDNFSVYELIWLPYLASFLMLFQTTDDHRTLQDRFAKTVVVREKMRQEA